MGCGGALTSHTTSGIDRTVYQVIATRCIHVAKAASRDPEESTMGVRVQRGYALEYRRPRGDRR